MPRGSKQAKELARMEAIVAQNKYNRIIAEAARELPGLDPKVLKAFLIQESGLNPEVVNSLGYAGIAQFGARDAGRAGLTVNGKVDERLDPEKAIPAAVRFLKDKADWLERTAYKKYGSPQGEERIKFALAAYNGGEGVVAHAMKVAYEKGLKEAQGKGLTGDAAVAYAREYATKWDNLLQPISDIQSSPLYSATSRYYPRKIAQSKYREIGAFPVDIFTRARQ